MTNARVKHGQYYDWCAIKGLHTTFKCPNGCLNDDGNYDEMITDQGTIHNGEKLYFDCIRCGFTETYDIKIRIVKRK